MKALFLVGLLLLAVLVARAQTDSDAYYGNKEYRAVMGGGDKVKYDTITPLIDLIKRLEKPWEFAETMKAYWIGYTDDMYSIAQYKDKAIGPLVDLIDTSHNLKARQGALFTIHLIGINFRVVGRFSEDFENKNAREALLKYLDNAELNETVMSLLMRDPWSSDIPKLIDYLSKPGRDYSKVLGALQRYNFDGKPFEQELKDSIFKKIVDVGKAESWQMLNVFALIAFQRALAPNFVVDKEITESKAWKKSVNELSVKGPAGEKLSFEFFIHSNAVLSFCDFTGLYDFVLHGNQVEIYGPIKARQIWLEWWKRLPQSDKDKLRSSNHIPW